MVLESLWAVASLEVGSEALVAVAKLVAVV